MTIFDCICKINFGSLADWTTSIITLIGICIALYQFISYRKELKNKVFIEFRQRFKADPINVKIFEFINGNIKSNIPTDYEVNHFIGFYEELHKMYKDNQVSINDLIYFFGNYYLKVFEHSDLSEKIKSGSNYWARAVDLYKLMKENEKSVLEEISSTYKHKDNLTFLKKDK